MLWNETLKTEENRQKYSRFATEKDKDINSFLEFDAMRKSDTTDGKGELAGMPYGVKDNIAVKDFKLTCASRILENFVSPYNATAVEKLEKSSREYSQSTNAFLAGIVLARTVEEVIIPEIMAVLEQSFGLVEITQEIFLEGTQGTKLLSRDEVSDIITNPALVLDTGLA